MNFEQLDRTIKEIWINEIQKDYNDDMILNEDTLKNVLYHHLRSHLEKSFELNSFVIYTECTKYGFSTIHSRPDMIIVEKDTQKIVAIFEIKYKTVRNSRVEGAVYYDFDKIKEYINTLDSVHSKCNYYIAAITLGEYNRPNWLDGRSKWAKGRVNELIAYEPNETLSFQVISH